MHRHSITLGLVFLLLAGCGPIKLYYSDATWAPESAPTSTAHYPQMTDNARRCNNGFYTGLSAQNIDPLMSQRCEKLEDGNSICAFRIIDWRIETERRDVYDPVTKKTTSKYVDVEYDNTYMINTYINEKGIVYDCRAESAHYEFVPPKPQPGTLAYKLPQN